MQPLQVIATQLDGVKAEERRDIRMPACGRDVISDLVDTMNSTLDAFNARIREREVMLREIHHRVKNNLQVIASLLSLQAGKSEKTVQEALDKGRRRILALAHVYNSLYESSNVSSIGMEGFLRNLPGFLDPEREYNESVRLNIRSEKIDLEIDTALPLGLILCELLSNAYRHGFPGGRSGTVDVAARGKPGGGCLVEIRDNGVGVASTGGRKDSGLGLTIVEALVSQLGGGFTMGPAPNGGTLCVLTVPA